MNDGRARFLGGLSTSVAVLVLGVGAIACGGSDDDGDASASKQESTSAAAGADGTASGSDQREVAAVMHGVRKAFNATDGDAFCSRLTAAGQREVNEYATSPEVFTAYNTRGCSKFITKYTKKVVPMGGAHKPVRILKIEVDGDKAKVSMKGGLAGIRSIATYNLVKDNGTWELDDPISGAATRKLPEELQKKLNKGT